MAGLEATQRFQTGAAALAAFSVVQLLVYAALQIPVGVLVDRFGPRVLILCGAALMALGQLQLAAATSVPGGLVARVLVGAGDAMTFISVLRLLPAWFSPRRVPLLTQLTGLTGQLGQLLSAVPLAAVLHTYGWSPAFLAAAGLSVIAFLAVLAGVRDRPSGEVVAVQPVKLREMGSIVAAAWRQPGTRLGLWSHFVTQFSGNVFLLTWGVPFLVSGLGWAPGQASLAMTLFIPTALVSGPWLGGWVDRHPLRRSNVVLTIASLAGVAWALVLFWPGVAPGWLVILLIITLGLGGPASMIGFDFARTFNPAQRLGTATGIVNVGGYVASVVTMYLVGLLLDLQHTMGLTSQLYTLDAFRVALSAQLLVLIFGLGAVMLTRVRTRRELAARGITVPPLREALRKYPERRRKYRADRH